ncbi:MAG TPA: ABC transporter substrate-binding protein [Acidimicrobiales bacterium]
MRGNESARRLALALVVAALLGAACGGDDDTASGGTTTTAPEDGGSDAAAVLGPVDEASGDPVRVGFITDGANATTDQSIDLDVAAATVEYLNKHKAGIGGRPIELVTCEAQLDPARGTDCGNQMVEQQVVAVVVGTTGVVQPVWTPLHDAGIPTMFFAGAGDDVLADTRSTFSLTDPTAGTVGVPIAVAKANDEDKVTVIVIDVPPALAAYEGAGAQQFEDAGLDLELVRVPPGTADMTAQLQPVIAGHPGVIHVLGNDAFCIAAFQAMHSLGFDGPVTSITQCITDATRQAIPGDQLDGIVVGSAAPVDAGNEMDELYRTVMETFGSGIDTSRITGHGSFTAMAGFASALEGISGEITPATVTATIKAMPEQDLPDGGGLTFRCDGQQVPGAPAACVRGTLVTTLDADGEPTDYQAGTGE